MSAERRHHWTDVRGRASVLEVRVVRLEERGAAGEPLAAFRAELTSIKKALTRLSGTLDRLEGGAS